MEHSLQSAACREDGAWEEELLPTYEETMALSGLPASRRPYDSVVSLF